MSERTPGGLFLVDDATRDELARPVIRPPFAQPRPIPSFSTGRRVNVHLASEYFITDAEGWLVELDAPALLLAPAAITEVAPLVTVLEACAREARPIAIGAPAIGLDVLAFLVVNKLRGTLACAAFELDGSGLDDLARVAGGSGAIPWPSEPALDDLPRADRIVMSPDGLSIRPR